MLNRFRVLPDSISVVDEVFRLVFYYSSNNSIKTLPVNHDDIPGKRSIDPHDTAVLIE